MNNFNIHVYIGLIHNDTEDENWCRVTNKHLESLGLNADCKIIKGNANTNDHIFSILEISFNNQEDINLFKISGLINSLEDRYKPYQWLNIKNIHIEQLYLPRGFII